MTRALRAIEDARLLEREANLRDTPGSLLPAGDERGGNHHSEDRRRRQAERHARILQFRRLGYSTTRIMAAMALTRRQVTTAETAPRIGPDKHEDCDCMSCRPHTY